mgnify:CR=1 FL=1
MDFLKRSLAPIPDSAWEEINEQAKIVFNTQMTARRFVDVSEPKGWDYAAEPRGRLQIKTDPEQDDIGYGIHQVLPLVEMRVPFELDIWEMDNAVRGARDIDLDPLVQAAQKFVAFEEQAIYYKFPEAGIVGLKNASSYKAKNVPSVNEQIPNSVDEGMSEMVKNGIGGPYTLVVGPKHWRNITGYANGYPLNKHLTEITGGKILLCPAITEMFLVSERGGDFKLTLGTDVSIGYERHDSKTVRLFFTESFTFQVLEPQAVMYFK